jgi:hypothetical protein
MLGDPAIAAAVENAQAPKAARPRHDTSRAVAALWSRSRPIVGTHADAYLAARGCSIDAGP